MFVASLHSFSHPFLAGWELVLILALLLILFGAKKLPDIIDGMGNGKAQFRKEVDDLAQDVGKSVGGIFGKPAAEALTPDNHIAELYDPAAFRKSARKPSILQRLRHVCRIILKWVRLTLRGAEPPDDV